MAKAEDVIRIAIDEIGYHEKATNANLDDKTANSGSNNWNKYARDLDTTEMYNYPKLIGKVAAWCTIFVDWCHWIANNKNLDKTLYETCQQKKSTGAGTIESYRFYKAAGRIGKDPKVGADIFYTSNGKEAGIHHTGIVEKFDSQYVYTIEGNVSNMTKRVKTPRNSSKIYGYGYPRYDVEPTGNGFTTVPATSSITIHKMGELSKIALATGKVTANTLNIRTLPGASNPQLKSVPFIKKDTVVNICDAVKADDGSTWYYIQTSGKYGFVAAKYIQLIGNASVDDANYQDGSVNYATR